MTLVEFILVDLVVCLFMLSVKKLTKAISVLAKCVDVEKKAFRMYDTDRAQVYSKHLGEKLR